MVTNTSLYTGMNLKGEIRESISLDEDDLSDVEDEVFIRDGKNGYKLADDINVKRPLMAPRRKHGRHDSGTRLKHKFTCRAWCKPCCYIIASLSVLIGLITLVVVLVSIYPIPLDKLRDWVISKSNDDKTTTNHLPCTSLKVTDIWTVNLPTLTTDSPIRSFDINGDGIDDILFGFGAGENYNIFPPDIFCPIFLGVSPPCQGGIIALNGLDGKILWRHWLNDTVFSLHCSADINGDGSNDCLAVGVDGTIVVVNAKDGQEIWKLNKGKMNVFLANFMPDQNRDNISDVLSSQSSLNDKSSGHLIIICGKTGREIKRISTPTNQKSFFMPQILNQNDQQFVIFGTGTPNVPGNLSVVPLDKLDLLDKNSTTIYEDKFKGMLTQPLLIDITGDGITDIVASMYNSTIVAIDGKTFNQLWNYSIPNAITDMSPTPAYFNSDNITDFLVIYQKYDDIFNYNYTQTLIIDGLTGQPIYQPISGGVITQMNGLTLSMEGHGRDIFLFWTSECSSNDASNNANPTSGKDVTTKSYDECRRQFNSTSILKLNALNEYHQPPGITIYNSALKSALEYNNTKSATMKLRDYLKNHPDKNSNLNPRGQSEIPKVYNGDPVPIGIRKYGKSSFRHKDRPSGIVKDFDGSPGNMNNDPQLSDQEPNIPDQSPIDYNIWLPNQEDLESEFASYNLPDDTIPYNQKQMLFNEVEQKMPITNRDPRSKEKPTKEPPKLVKSKKKNLSDKIFSYHNVRLAKNRLLHDEENLPIDILKDTYFKNERNRLKKAKFEQRDVNSHLKGATDEAEVKRIIEEEKNSVLNGSTTLWDIETEKEMFERDDGGLKRGKREIEINPEVFETVSRITSVGAVLSSFNVSNNSNSIDVVFIKYWQPIEKTLEGVMKNDIKECISEKILRGVKDEKTTEAEQKSLFQKECQEEQDSLRRNFPYFAQLGQLKLGQMTVYRIRIECECDASKGDNVEGKCVKFLPKSLQGWPSYLGKNGDGVFLKRG